MSIEKVLKWVQGGAVISALALSWICLSGCHSPSNNPQFAELTPGGSAAGGSSKPATEPAKVSVATATAATAAPAPGSAAPVAGTNSLAPETSVLRVGDSLIVTFTDTPNIIPPFDLKIKEDGKITLLLNEEFKAEGKTAGDLAKEIRARYVPDYFRQMTVTVKHQESTQWYYVDGEVKSPNRQIYNTRMTVLKAIASVGGFTDFANKKSVRLTRVDGRTYTINCVKALDNPALDLEIYPGDKIYVKRRFW